MLNKPVIAWSGFISSFFLVVFMAISNISLSDKDALIAAGLVTLIASPFAWVFIKSDVKTTESYVSLAARLKRPWSMASYPFIGFLCTGGLAIFFIGEDKNRHIYQNLIGTLLLIALIFLLLSIVAVIYERTRRGIGRHN